MRVLLDVVHGRGAPQAIELDSVGVEDARRQAEQQGYAVLGVRRATGDWRSMFASRGSAVSRFDTVVFVEQLRDLLAAGLSVIEALGALQQGASARSRPALEQLIRRLRAGERMSDALNADGRFSPLLVSLVRASELTSDLPQALTRFLEHEQRVAELRHRITSAAIYPLLLTGVGAAVLAFLLLYVMPRFARVFDGMQGALPWSARAMLWWAHWLQAQGPWLLAWCLVVAAALVTIAASPVLRNRALRWLFGWAPLREHLRTYFLARWYRATGMLVAGGIPLPEALALSNRLLPEALRGRGGDVERALRDGHGPAEAHARAGMATPVAEQLLRAGERTGDMGGLLARIAQFHDADVARALERRMRLLEPAVMVLIGLGVGVVVVLMYLPIFELAAAIQ